MITVDLNTIDKKSLKIDLIKQNNVVTIVGILEGNTVIDIIRIFRPGELLSNVGTVVFGKTYHESGLFLYLDKENTTVLDAAFEELGCTGEDKELCYRVG